MKAHWAVRVPFFVAIGVAAIAAFSALVMLLWNWLAPALFHLPSITLVQALGLLVLCRILFGSFGGGGGMGRRHWRRRMHERFERMTPEERERFRRGVCDAPPASEA
jgi:hypothetical protein